MIDTDELRQRAEELEPRSASEILRWAAERFAPRLTFAASLGLEDCAVIDLIGRASLPIDLFTLDTGLLFPETYELKRKIDLKDHFLLVETLPATAYHHAHLPGAINLPPDQIDKLAPQLLLDKNADIVVYCASPT